MIKNDTSVERLRDYMRDLKEGTASPTSDQWSVWISQCRRWGVEPFETYRGELVILCYRKTWEVLMVLVLIFERIGPWTVKDGLNKTAFVFFLYSAQFVRFRTHN